MRRDDAIASLQGRLLPLSSPRWGTYLCGPISIVAPKGRPWRAQGPILRVMGLPQDGLPCLKEGDLMDVGGANVRESEVLDAIPETLGASFGESVQILINGFADMILRETEELKTRVEEILSDPGGMEMCPTSFKNTRMTYRRLGMGIVEDRLFYLHVQERQFCRTANEMRLRGVLGEPSESEKSLESSRGERMTWAHSLKGIDLGPTEIV